jgi:mono/diheme cytochrome c family protein
MGSDTRPVLFTTLAAWTSVTLLSAHVAAQGPASVPDNQSARIERGRQVVAQTCATCHATLGRMLQVHKQTEAEWRATVYFMISRGAQIMPDEIEPVTSFLTATAGSHSQAGTQPSVRGRSGARDSGPQTPDGDGEAVLRRACQQCHTLETASTTPGSDWGAVVARMMGYGARLSPADQQKLIEYLNGLKR